MLKESYSKNEIAGLLKGVPSSGQIEVRLINPKRTGTITVREYYAENEATGSREFKPFIDMDGNPRVVKYNKKKILDLRRDNDRLEYAHLKEHPLYVSGANPILKLVDFEDDAATFVILKDNEAKANKYISEFNGEKLKDLARVLQIKVREGSSESVLKRALYEFAALPKSVSMPVPGAVELINQLESPEYELKAMLRKSMETGIVKVVSGRYMFGQTSMANSFDSTINWLKDNPDLESEMTKKVKSNK